MCSGTGGACVIATVLSPTAVRFRRYAAGRQQRLQSRQTGRITRPSPSLRGLRHLALDLRVGPEVVHRAGHDGEQDRAQLRAAGLLTPEIAALVGREGPITSHTTRSNDPSRIVASTTYGHSGPWPGLRRRKVPGIRIADTAAPPRPAGAGRPLPHRRVGLPCRSAAVAGPAAGRRRYQRPPAGPPRSASSADRRRRAYARRRARRRPLRYDTLPRVLVAGHRTRPR